uniref:helix-turn-helix domain-containing protein n=1 Tax=Sphingomonas populi TaxID=2484750 RepID=UPI003D093967
MSAALKLIAASVSPAEAARQLGIGRSTVYREMKRLGVARPGINRIATRPVTSIRSWHQNRPSKLSPRIRGSLTAPRVLPSKSTKL